MRRRCKNRIRRDGSMLIELCLNMAAASMVMLLGVTLIERSMHWTQSMQKQTNLQRELSLLAADWRADFSKAQRVDFQSGNRVVLSMPGKDIVYESKDNQVQRRCELKEPLAAKPSAPENYVLGVDYLATFESPYLIVRATNPAGETVSTRLRVLGKPSDQRYRILEDLP